MSNQTISDSRGGDVGVLRLHGARAGIVGVGNMHMQQRVAEADQQGVESDARAPTASPHAVRLQRSFVSCGKNMPGVW